MCEPTKRQQQWEDTVIEECNSTKYRTISPGLCGECPQCQSDFGMDLEQSDFQYHEWQERDRLHIELRNDQTEFTLIEFWGDDARQFLEDYRERGQSVSDCLWEYVDDCDLLDSVLDDVFHAILNEKVSNQTYLDEGGFSHRSCECCGNPLGGNRYAAHAIADDGSILHYDICSDCLFYLANGDLPEDEYLEWID